MVKVNRKCRPAIECVGDCISKSCLWRFNEFHFIQPVFEQSKFWLCQSLTHIFAFSLGQRGCYSFDVEQTFDNSHWQFCRFRIVLPGILEIAMHVCPTVGSGSAICNDVVEFVGSICLQDSCVAGENLLRIDGVLGVRIIVEDVWIVGIATVNPDESPVCFSKPLFDNRKSGGIGLKDATVQDESTHSSGNWGKKVSNLFQPSAHGGPINGDTQGSEHLLLPVKRQVQPEFISCNLGKESWTRQPFINRLVRFLSSNYLTITVLACVLEHDVLDAFKQSPDKVNLVRNIKADDLSCLSTARTWNVFAINAMFSFASYKSRGWRRSSAAMFIVRNNIQAFLLGTKFLGGLTVNSFAGTGKQSSIDFGRLLTKGRTVSPAELFFEFGDAIKELSDEVVTFGEVIREVARVIETVFGMLVWHCLLRVTNCHIILDATTGGGIRD